MHGWQQIALFVDLPIEFEWELVEGKRPRAYQMGLARQQDTNAS